MLGGPCLRLGIPEERFDHSAQIWKNVKNAGGLVTWDCPMSTDSASLKSLESFMQRISFCSSWILPVISRIVCQRESALFVVPEESWFAHFLNCVSEFLEHSKLVSQMEQQRSLRSIMTHWRQRQTGRQAFFFRVIGPSSARVRERLADGAVIVVEVIGEPLLHRGFLGEVLISLLDVVLVGLTTCGRLVLGQSAKILSGGAQGICPPHPGRWSWLAERRTGWSEKTWGRKRNEWSCRRDQKQRSHNAHETWDVIEWVRTQTWAMRVHVIHCENWTVCCSRPLSAVNDLTATNLKKSWKSTRLTFCEKTALTKGLPVPSWRSLHELSCGHSC